MLKILTLGTDWNLTGTGFFCKKRLIECLHRFLLDRRLHMQIMLCHIQIRMTNHTLDCSQVNTKRLHLAHIGMSTGMWCQHADITNNLDIILELIAIFLWIEGLLFFGRLDDKFVVSIQGDFGKVFIPVTKTAGRRHETKPRRFSFSEHRTSGAESLRSWVESFIPQRTRCRSDSGTSPLLCRPQGRRRTPCRSR